PRRDGASARTGSGGRRGERGRAGGSRARRQSRSQGGATRGRRVGGAVAAGGPAAQPHARARGPESAEPRQQPDGRNIAPARSERPEGRARRGGGAGDRDEAPSGRRARAAGACGGADEGG